MKKTALFLILFTCVNAASSASDRVRSALRQDNYIALENLQEKRDELLDFRASLKTIDSHLKTTAKGQNIYYNFQKIGGTVLLIGVVIGSYKAYFPPGFRAMLGAYVTVNGISKGMVKLSNAEVQGLMEKIKNLNILLDKKEDGLNTQIAYYCAQENYHSICE